MVLLVCIYVFCICKTLFSKYWPELSKIVPSTADDPGKWIPGNGSPGRTSLETPSPSLPYSSIWKIRSETLAINALCSCPSTRRDMIGDLVTGYRPNFLINPKLWEADGNRCLPSGLKIGGKSIMGFQHYEFPNRFHEMAEGQGW